MKNTKTHPGALVKTIGIIPAKADHDNICIQLAAALANYITAAARKKVSVVSLSDSGFIDCLCQFYKPKCNPDKAYFELFGVKYYFQYSEKYFFSLINESSDYIILIANNPFVHASFLLSAIHRKIAAGSLVPWEAKHYTDFLKRMEPFYSGKNNWSFCAQYFSDKDKKSIEKDFRISIQQIPFDLNPFKIKQNEFSFFEKLLM